MIGPRHSKLAGCDGRSYPSREAMGDQPEWGRYLPDVWRALADPGGTYPYPPCPDPVLDPAWWNPLLHVMRFSLGWADPAKGLWRWYNAGRPIADHRLRFIANSWGDDLDFFAAWLWEPRLDEMRALPDVRAEVTDDAWWGRITHRQAGFTDPHWSLGNDSLHLWVHAEEWQASSETTLGGQLCADVATARATLLLDTATGWYSELTPAWRELPQGAPRDWRVDVVVRPIGWMGTYRRSWTTGRYFTGRHRWHELGNK